MALTKSQFIALRQRGLNVQDILAFERGDKPEDIQRRQQIQAQTQGNQFETDTTTGLSGVGKFLLKITGGRKIAEGLGQAIAAPSVQRTLSQEQEETSVMQQKGLELIRAKRERGEDTSRLEKALQGSQELQTFLADVQQDFGESLVTGKEIAGSALRLATFAAGGTIGRFAGKALALGKTVTFGAGALRGAGAGAITGGVFGGLTGAGIALEEGGDEVLKSATTGAVLGVLAGGVLGAVTGGFTGILRGRKIAREDFSKELVSPKQTPKTKAEAIRQGRLEDAGLLQKAKIQVSKRDVLVASSVDDVVSPKLKVGENIDAIRAKISKTNNGVKAYIQANKVPFNVKQLNTRLESGKDELRLVFASDTSAEKTYNAVVKEFMRNVSKKDTLGLFEARQNFDQIPAIKKLLQSQGLGENAKKEIVLQVRRQANEYVASLLPKNNPFAILLKRESLMLEGLGNIAEKTAEIVGKNKLQLIAQEYPILALIAGGVIGTIATLLGLRLAGGVGAGSSLIGSSD